MTHLFGWKGGRESLLQTYSGMVLNTLKTRLYKRSHKKSYSQCGEDLIVAFLLEHLNIRHPSYLDVGAHHATWLSNTYLFYKQGGHGVCVEPDPLLFTEIQRKRKKDICLNVGIGKDFTESAEFFLMNPRTLSTFSREEAERYQTYAAHKLEKVLRIPLIPINRVMEDYFKPCPNFISMDVEGLELDILKTINFERFRPEVFCLETLSYTADKSAKKVTEVIDFMNSNSYSVYADTFINTIFVDNNVLRIHR